MATELILIRHGYTVRVHGDYVHAARGIGSFDGVSFG
jgi:hypothetical protein